MREEEVGMKRLAVCLLLVLSIGGPTGLIASGYLLAAHYRHDALLAVAGAGVAVAGLACIAVAVGSYLRSKETA